MLEKRAIYRERIDAIIQYALAVAKDKLGAIHLVKYVYLADLRYSEEHGGETFTGVPWVFLHFGPWAPEVQERVEPAAADIHAQSFPFRTQKAEGVFVRYRVTDESLAERLRPALPAEVAASVRWAVLDHGGDTASLLRIVYHTKPMLRAAPRQLLDFSPRPQGGKSEPIVVAAAEPATVRERRARKAELAQRKAEFQRRLREQDEAVGRLLPPFPPPSYDEVFFEGTAELDRLAGEPIQVGECEIVVDPGIWKSPTRSELDD